MLIRMQFYRQFGELFQTFKAHSALNSSNMVKLTLKVDNQRTNGPVNAHLISGPTVSTKTSFAKFDFVLKWVKVKSGSCDLYHLYKLSFLFPKKAPNEIWH